MISVIVLLVLVGAFITLIGLIILYIIAKLTLGRCTCNTYLAGKTALITGGNSGLGYETAIALAGRGCRVILADVDDCEFSKQAIEKLTGNDNIVTKQFDLASFESVRKLASEINKTEERLDILINNAGVAASGNSYTNDGLHKQTQINHFGPFLLTHLLLELLKKSAPSRIIFVSSFLAFVNSLTAENINHPNQNKSDFWSGLFMYSNSKLSNIITAKELSRKLAGTGITANSLHPGLVYTKILQNASSKCGYFLELFLNYMFKYYAKSPEEGAQTIIHLAISKELKTTTGKYFSDCKVFIEPIKALNDKFCASIWEASENYVKLLPTEKITSDKSHSYNARVA